MKLTRKLLASTLTLALLLSLMPLAFAAGSYSDVSNDAWYAQAVTYVTDNALMPGVSDNTFAPNDNADRATVAEALWKAAGSPEASVSATFSDVSDTASYKPAVDWAVEKGLITGYPDGTFGGNGDVSREELVTMLWRNAGSPAAPAPTFADAGSIGSYAMTAVAWAQTEGVVNGVGGNRFVPKGPVTRAQLATVLMNLLGGDPGEIPAYADGALSIAKQGYFSSGGTVTEAVSGTYDPTTNWMDTERPGNTAHVDHANVFYQIPSNDNGNPIVYLHGYGQSRMGWMTTPDGREGWSDIFLRYGHPAFLVDQPRRGEAGAAASMTADGFLDAWAADSKDYKPGDQAWYTHFRIGRVAPERYEGSQFPAGDEAQNQFFRQMTPNTGSFDQSVAAAALGQVMADVKEMTGSKSIFITHSQGGAVGWDVDPANVAAIVAIEPGGTPAPGSDQYKALLEAKVPIIVYFGDYIDNGPEDIMSTGFWKGIRDGALAFAEQYNADGGDATVIDLPKIGLTGNSHFMFQEMNNKDIADHIEGWLAEHGLT